MTNYVDNIYMVTEECCNCGLSFAMTQEYKARRLKDQKPFYCPSGHRQWYTGKTTEQKLKEQLKVVNKQLGGVRSNLQNVTRQKNRTVLQYKKIRSRVKNGVCPCCHRQFPVLLKHMKTKHPDFGDHDILKSIRNIYGLTQIDLANEIGITAISVSKYENKKPLPDYAGHLINEWMKKEAG